MQVIREQVLTWFDGQADFEALHRQTVVERQIVRLVRDDFD
jgi:hypothetical protein